MTTKKKQKAEAREADSMIRTINGLLDRATVKHPEHAAEYSAAKARGVAFSYPYKTTFPKELAGWEDRSWGNDASACCWLSAPTKQNPRAVLIAWAQPDDREEWELPEHPRFQLDYVLDSDEGWDDATSRIVLMSDDIEEIVTAAEKLRSGVR